VPNWTLNIRRPLRCAFLWQKAGALADLRLGGNRIGESGAVTLASSVRECKALTDLWLGGNKVGALGKAALADSKPAALNLHF
jgi:hypothetical protein